MMYDEATEIAKANGWAYGGVGREMWEEFKATYLAARLGKRQMVYLYWCKTGYYERLAHAVKKLHEAEKDCQWAMKSCAGANSVYRTADALADSASGMVAVEDECEAVCKAAGVEG